MDITELSRGAWNALRNEFQPAFDDLEESYRQGLLDRAQNVITLKRVTEEGGVFQTFEQNVIEELNPERFHPLSKQFRPDLFEPETPMLEGEVPAELVDIPNEGSYNHDAVTEAVVKANTPKKAAAKKKAVKATEKKAPVKKAVKVIKGAAKKK